MRQLRVMAVALLPLALACGDVADSTPDAASSEGGGDRGDGGEPDAAPVACQRPADCDDGIACTVDTCNDSEVCEIAAQDDTCDDGEFCNGVEICSATDGCVSGDSPDCGASDACTARGCSNEQGECTETPLTYAISWSFGAEGGTVPLGCDISDTVYTHTIVGTAGSCDIDFVCGIQQDGMLQATYAGCSQTGTGPFVLSGCSIVGEGDSAFECCFPP